MSRGGWDRDTVLTLVAVALGVAVAVAMLLAGLTS